MLGETYIKPKKHNIFRGVKTNNKSIKIKINGRLNGATKARKYVLGNIKTSSMITPIDFSSNPVQTKYGKYGLKVYLIKNKKWQ